MISTTLLHFSKTFGEKSVVWCVVVCSGVWWCVVVCGGVYGVWCVSVVAVVRRSVLCVVLCCVCFCVCVWLCVCVLVCVFGC